MTTTIQNLSDLQDRRIMMDKKLPPYARAPAEYAPERLPAFS